LWEVICAGLVGDSEFRNRLVPGLRRDDWPRAAKWISDAIGEIEVERLKESRSMRLFGSRKSYAMESHQRVRW
jgi:hypothetical protein